MPTDKPWFNHYSTVPHSLDYPQVTMYEALLKTALRVPDKIAWDFMGTLCTYRDFSTAISQCADALSSLGLKRGDTITISMAMVKPGSTLGILQAKIRTGSFILNCARNG